MSTISVDYDVLNQKGSPAWFSDTFANIPTAGYVGRMFISIDTYAFYRDTGTGWNLIGGPGTGTITGSGTAGQVSYFNGSSTLAGSNNLFWDNTNGRLGINTTTPGVPLDIHGTGTQLQLNGIGGNNSYLVFQNSGASKWRIGNLNTANSFEIYNAATSSYALTIASVTNEVVIQGKLTIAGIVSFGSTLTNNTYTYTLPSATGTLALTSNLSSYLPLAGGTLTGALIGTSATFSGNLTIDTNTLFVDSTNNNVGIGTISPTIYGGGLEVSRASQAGVRVSSTGTGAGGVELGYSGGAAYIQTITAGSDLQIVTGAASVNAMLLKANGNVLIGTTTDAGYRLDVNGTGRFTGALTGAAATFSGTLTTNGSINQNSAQYIGNSAYFVANVTNGFRVLNAAESVALLTITNAGNVGINSTPLSNYKVIIKGADTSGSNGSFVVQDSSGNNLFVVRNDGLIQTGLQTSSPYNSAISGRSAIIDNSGTLGYLVSTKESKSNIESIKNIDFINKLNPVQFNYRKKDINTNTFIDELYDNITYGFIADEVEKVDKNLVFYNENNTLAGVEYNNMIAILTKAIQELNEKLVRNNIN